MLQNKNVYSFVLKELEYYNKIININILGLLVILTNHTHSNYT